MMAPDSQRVSLVLGSWMDGKRPFGLMASFLGGLMWHFDDALPACPSIPEERCRR